MADVKSGGKECPYFIELYHHYSIADTVVRTIGVH